MRTDSLASTKATSTATTDSPRRDEPDAHGLPAATSNGWHPADNTSSQQRQRRKHTKQQSSRLSVAAAQRSRGPQQRATQCGPPRGQASGGAIQKLSSTQHRKGHKRRAAQHAPRAPAAVKHHVCALNLAAGREGVLQLLPCAVPRQVVDHHLQRQADRQAGRGNAGNTAATGQMRHSRFAGTWRGGPCSEGCIAALENVAGAYRSCSTHARVQARSAP